MSVRPTNAWFMNFMLGTGRGVVHQLPYLLVSGDAGLDVCWPGIDTSSYSHAAIAQMAANITLGATPAASAPKLTAFGDLSATLTWTVAGGAMVSDVVRGSAYATMRYTTVRPVVSTIHAITSVNGTGTDLSSSTTFPSGTKFKIGLDNGQTWIIYTSSPVTFTIASGKTLTATEALTGTVRVALLPAAGGEAALDAGAPAIHTGGSVTKGFAGANMTKTITWSFNGTGTPLGYAMPHHQKVLVSPSYPTGLTLSGGQRGTLRAVSGATWTLTMPSPMPSWHNANPPRADRVQAIKDALAVDKNYIPSAWPHGINDTMADPYFGSKWQAKGCRLALIADYLGDTAARDQLLGNVKTVFTRFLLGNDPGTRLRYETTWGGIVSEKGLTDGGVDFGNGRFNDHYFHYGYMIYAAAVIAKYDPAWLATHKARVNDLVRDIANPSASDPYFTKLRHFDDFEGHSWASGNNQDAQANQESTSEAAHAWYSVYLWGQVSSQENVANLGRALFTEEVLTAQEYWQIRQASTVYPDYIKAYGCIGIVWSFKYEVGTWFSAFPAQLEHVHAIQMLPINPVSEILLPKAWLAETWAANLLPLLNRNPAVELPWWTLLVTAHGQVDPDDSWARLINIPADRESWDNGFSKTQALYHVATSTALGADGSPPLSPVGLAPSSVTPTGFTAGWSPSTDDVGVTGYEVFVDGASVATTSGTSYALTGLTPGATYSVTVRARDAAGNWSAQSSPLSVIMPVAVQLFPTQLPSSGNLNDGAAITLATRFSSSTAGKITALRFYAAATAPSTAQGTLYSDTGEVLFTGSYSNITPAAWNTLPLPTPFAIDRDAFYRVAYFTNGPYVATGAMLASPITSGPLTAVGGYFRVEPTPAFPSSQFNNGCYFADVVFEYVPLPVTAPGVPLSLAPTAGNGQVSLLWLAPASDGNATISNYEVQTFTGGVAGSVVSAGPTPYLAVSGLTNDAAYQFRVRAINSAGAGAWTELTAIATPASSKGLPLPLIPWEGGPAYWSRFSKAAAAGWTDPAFFPIGIDPAPFSSAAEVQWDKSLGINTYCGGLNTYSPWSLLESNGMSFIGARYSSVNDGMMPADFSRLVGYRLDDETDGTFPNPADGFAHLSGLIAQYGNRSDGRFMYNNYTQQVVAVGFSAKNRYVNDFTDAVSLDMYWYTIPTSSFGQNVYVSSVEGPPVPRSADAYGAMTRGLRQVDESDFKKQPVWMYIENLYGGPGDNGDPTRFVRYIEPAEIKAAVMSSLIAEARGILWFNSAMNAPADRTAVGNVIRQAQVSPDFFGRPQVDAMGQINNQVHALAPVLNTQSYAWSFGSGLRTMLKARDGFAYIFAMADAAGSGSRTFTLPASLAGAAEAEVVGESRTVTVTAGAFTDSFAAESSYHIYKLAIPVPAAAAGGPSQSLFTTQTPSSPNNADPEGPLTVGTEFIAEEDGFITGVRLYRATTSPSSAVGLLYHLGAEVARATFGPLAAGWNTVTFASPVQVFAGSAYVAGAWTSGPYVSSSGLFPITNGDLRGLAGRYQYGATPTNPTNGSAGVYFVDPVFALPGPDQLVPWEGGSAYYSGWAETAAAGMADPSFFPILVDLESVADTADVAKDKAYGVNGYYRITSNSNMQAIRDAGGMVAFVGPTKAGVGAETVSWNVDDEVDMNMGGGWNVWNGKYPGETPAPTANSGYDAMAQLTSATGPQGPMVADGRLLHMNYGKGVAMWFDFESAKVFTNGGSHPDGRSFALDAVSIDLYFYSDTNVAQEAQTWLGIPAGEVRRAINYGRHEVQRVRSLQASAGIFQPVYGFVEVASQGSAVLPEELTDDKIEGAVWACIVYEARGIIYFVHDFTYSGGFHVLRDNSTGHTPRVTDLNARLKALAPILNTQSVTGYYNPSVKSMTKLYQGSRYIFAMSKRQAVHDAGPRVFTLPAGTTATTVTVVNENRTLPVSGGAFTDAFAAEFTHHLYKV